MRIDAFVWPEDRIEHIARHGVTPEKWNRSASDNRSSYARNPRARIRYTMSLGQTEAGRYLFCVVIRFPDGNRYPVTAREMTAKEKGRYRKWKGR
jgi:uncharacterized protein